MTRNQVGIVGAGEIAEVGHLPVYSSHSSIDVVAVADLNRERAKTVANDYGISHIYEDGQSLIDQEPLDAISICTPPSTHREFFISAAERGMDIFCEKPFALSVQDAERMHQAASQNDITTSIGYSPRYLRNYKKVASYVNTGLLGEPLEGSVRCIVPPPSTSWRYDPDVSGGGIITDMAPHWFDFYLELFETVPEVKDVNLNNIHTSDVEDYGSFELSFGDVDIDMTFRWMKSGMTSKAIRENKQVAEEGNVQFDRDYLEGNITGNGVRFKRGKAPVLSLGPLLNVYPRVNESSHQKAVSEFVEYLSKGTGDIVGSKRGLEVSRIKSRIYNGADL